MKSVMKMTAGLVCFLATVHLAVAQVSPDENTGETGTMNDLVLRPQRLPSLQEVGGSPFFSPDYKPATVKVNAVKSVPAVPVKFNIFNNTIMVQKGGEELKLEFFEQVAYDITEADGTVKHVIFRAGYPDVDNNTPKTIYQVLSMGPKLHLLKHITQKVEDAPTLGDYSRREIVTSEQLYVYIPGGEIKKIKSSKKDILSALPAYSKEINDISNANNLRLKSESDITLLAEELNKP